MEHHAIFDKVMDKNGERFVLVHEDYKGKLPKGTLVMRSYPLCGQAQSLMQVRKLFIMHG